MDSIKVFELKGLKMNFTEAVTKLVDSNVGKRLAAFLGSIYAITETEDLEGKVIMAILCGVYMVCQTVSDQLNKGK